MPAARHEQEIRRWMFDVALPFWAEHGVDKVHGGYVEQLTLGGQDAAVPFKRTRVACRQVYVFSHASMMGWKPGAELAAPGIEYLIAKCWQGEDKGFCRQLTRDGVVLDPTPDLYDHAFVLFAFAWHHRATGEKRSREWMHRTLDFVEAKMRHPKQGFWHELPGKGWRLQNPHMHLTEASLASFEATGEARFADLARELVNLFQTHFFDIKTGTLAEYFDDDLHRATGDEGRHTEPGHQMEWAWILNSARKLLGLDAAQAISAAIGFAEKHGVDPGSHAVYNVVRDDGGPIDRGSRTWPNNERLKAAVALYELEGVSPSRVFDETNELLLQRYLAHKPDGTWIDAFDGEGQPVVKSIPASTFYHVFLAFAEVLRISQAK